MPGSQQPQPAVPAWSVFIAAALLALAFVLCTQQAWEDFWITYKSSKNLATGHGLVYHAGERVHTFTSPLGVLLPALTCWIAGAENDGLSLWLFRGISILCFAGGAVFMYRTMLALRWHPLAIAITLAWMLTDAKSLNNATNGMETGILIGFLGATMWSLLACESRHRWLLLGLSWAGLMWTRPDGCIYIALLALSGLLFGIRPGETRRQFLKTLVLAGAVCTMLYLPWFLWAWSYYGSPVPNTVAAKGALAGPKSLLAALLEFVKFPIVMWEGLAAARHALMPANHIFGGWPAWIDWTLRSLTIAGSLLWLIPGSRREVKLVSFTVCGLLTYLNYYPAGAASWYFPAPVWLLMLGLGGLLSAILRSGVHRALRQCAVLVAAFVIGTGCWLTVKHAQQLIVEQTIVDDGNRAVLGRWLKAQAKPGETVFMECLGYIGYHSNLKTLDFPGLSSPEVVQAIREVGPEWHQLIPRLKPDWLALRPAEVTTIAQRDQALLTQQYELVKVFDVSDAVKKLDVRGHGFIGVDCVFFVFHRQPPD